MLLKIIRYAVLFLIFANFPGWVLVHVSSTISSLLSYASFGLMAIYFIFAQKWRLNIWMIVLGILYFGIASLNDQEYTPLTVTYAIIIVKYFITIIGGYAIIQDTSKKELFAFLIIGALSVFLQMFVFFNPLKDGGRYSGFYLNPNGLGFICMMGYALCFGLKGKWRLWGQIIFTLVGFLTFSRTFLLVWVIMNLLSVRLSIKNLKVLVLGVGLFVGLLVFNSLLPKSNARLEAMVAIMEGTSQSTKALEKGGRTGVWALYYDALFEKPFIGHGYDAFAGGGKVSDAGPHNAYIKIWGEGGILPIIIMLALYFFMIRQSWGQFMDRPHLFLMTAALLLFLATNHNYFDNGYILFFSMWLQYQILGATTKSNTYLTTATASNFAKSQMS